MRVLIVMMLVSLAACETAECEVPDGVYRLSVVETMSLSGGGCGTAPDESVAIGPNRTIADFAGGGDCQGEVTINDCEVVWNFTCSLSDGTTTRAGNASVAPDGTTLMGTEIFEIDSTAESCSSEYGVTYTRL